LGETFWEARDRAIVEALFVNNPGGGLVETVLRLRPTCGGIHEPSSEMPYTFGRRLALHLGAKSRSDESGNVIALVNYWHL